MVRKRRIALSIFAVLFVIFIITQVTQLFNTVDEDVFSSAGWRESTYQVGGIERVILLDVDGIITRQAGGFLTEAFDFDRAIKQVEAAFQDDRVAGIVMRINSPGGGVIESDELYHKIMDLKAEYDKPLVTYMTNTAASGGYYIALPSDKIYAHPSTITGSIGVILSTVNFSELAEEWGIREESFTSGPYKNLLSGFNEITQGEREIMQSLVDESYERFVDVLVEGRQMDRQRAYQLADGRIYSGSQAQEVGLIDEVGFLDDALHAVAELAEVENPTIIEYKVSTWPSFNNFLYQIRVGTMPISIDEMLHRSATPSLMYMLDW